MANELFATVDDINAHLPPNKAQINDADDDLLQTEAYRLIRAKLLERPFSATTIALWISPTTTPEIIRTIAGMVIAAKWYAELYAEDSDEDAEYAMNLWNQAMQMLQDIRDGLLAVIEVGGTTPIPGGTLLDTTDFLPNDDAPKFTMDKEFA